MKYENEMKGSKSRPAPKAENAPTRTILVPHQHLNIS